MERPATPSPPVTPFDGRAVDAFLDHLAALIAREHARRYAERMAAGSASAAAGRPGADTPPKCFDNPGRRA